MPAARVRESLAGRATRSRLLPLSLGEVTSDLGEKPLLVREQETERRSKRHLAVGGYPRVWLRPAPGDLLRAGGRRLEEAVRDARAPGQNWFEELKAKLPPR